MSPNFTEYVSAPAGFDWLRYIWMAGAAMVALRFVVSHIAAARLVLGAEAVEWEQGIEFRRSPEGVMPLTWGLLRAVILLPAGAAREVALHELAHAHRRDHWWLLMSQAACSFYWFHPLAWLAAHQAAEERERACDDWALANGAAPHSYAETLVAAARSGLAVPSAAMAVAGQTALEVRLRAILDPATNRRAASRLMATCAAVVAVVALLPVASAQKVYKVSDGITPPRVESKVEPNYTEEARTARINGTVVLYVEIDEEGMPRNVSVKRPLDGCPSGK